ncbi:MAG: methylenetetrahydrofolate reductase [Liquorilactobacillus mali]|uniref:methylenetetrahydrofolate reductase n=1 Tax=Liquorilactobacillus mali TaxID=1618 RepID=UPI0039EAEAD9
MSTFNYSLELLQNNSNSKKQALKKLAPEFISIAYTNHTLSFFETTFSTALTLKKVTNIKTAVHLPASSFTQEELDKLVVVLQKSTIDSALILSGEKKLNKNSAYTSALELAKFLSRRLPNLDILCSCHPETITSEINLQNELSLMRTKEATGCKIFISQIFFDNTMFIHFVNHCRHAGIKAQIRAGIMPIVNKNQLTFVKKILKLQLPDSFEQVSNDIELKKIGIQFALNQINMLKKQGITDFHFFTMDNLDTVKLLIDGVL